MSLDEASRTVLRSVIDVAITNIPTRVELVRQMQEVLRIQNIQEFVYGGVISDIVFHFSQYYASQFTREMSSEEMGEVWSTIIERSREIQNKIVDSASQNLTWSDP